MRPVTAEGGIDAITARKASSPTAIENVGRRALEIDEGQQQLQQCRAECDHDQ